MQRNASRIASMAEGIGSEARRSVAVRRSMKGGQSAVGSRAVVNVARVDESR
jgi:hypothetical protein